MANLVPFRGVLYNPQRVADVSLVVAPPYDVIDEPLQHALHARHPNNVIRLELGLDQPDDGPTHSRYTRAAASLRDWLAGAILRRDPAPAIYPYTVEYRVPSNGSGTGTKTLTSFLATVELEEFGTGRIYPHENTRSAAKADRLKLLEACRANFSPIFSLFSDPEGGILSLLEKSLDAGKPRVEFQDDAGFRHRLWSITDRQVLEEVAAAMRPKPLFIADGHHRYETALTYRHFRRQQAGSPHPGGLQPYDLVLMLFSSLEDPGLTVLPTHRVLRTPLPPLTAVKTLLQEAFVIEDYPFHARTEPEARRCLIRDLRAGGQPGPVFGLALREAGAYCLLRLRSGHPTLANRSPRGRLDVSILQQEVLSKFLHSTSDEEAILYTKDDGEALDLVRRGAAQAALLLNPTKVDEVRAVAAAGERMPHKSTYFFPKPLTGLVMNVME